MRCIMQANSCKVGVSMAPAEFMLRGYCPPLFVTRHKGLSVVAAKLAKPVLRDSVLSPALFFFV